MNSESWCSMSRKMLSLLLAVVLGLSVLCGAGAEGDSMGGLLDALKQVLEENREEIEDNGIDPDLQYIDIEMRVNAGEDKKEKEKNKEAVTDETGDYTYLLRPDGTAYLQRYNNKKKVRVLTIPEQLDGHTVTAIGESAFYEKKIDEVIVPETVAEIGDYAFIRSSIIRVTLPAALKKMGENPFRQCEKLKEIAFSADNPDFEVLNGVLFGTQPRVLIHYSLVSREKTYTVPDGTVSVGPYAFSGCKFLQGVVLPEGLKSIGRAAFDSCKKLKEINFPEGLTDIDAVAFEWTALTGAVFPESVRTIGEFAFMGSDLRSVSIPGSVRTIAKSSFTGCKKLKSVILGSGITFIDAWAFQNCTGLSSVELPETLTQIGLSAFENCKALKEITIPAGVKAINQRAFNGISRITVTVQAGSYAEGYYQKNQFKNVKLISVDLSAKD